MNKVIIATHNAGKLHEFRHLLSEHNWEITSPIDANISSIEETGLTFVENALIKARHAALKSGLPAIADDSGLVIDALDGGPGIFSARFAGPHASNEENIKQLLAALKPYKELHQRKGHFMCTLVYLRHARDPDPIIAQGRWYGAILDTPRGQNGFGYDPIFYVPEYQVSAAELEPNLKNKLSHRGQALQHLLHALKHDETQ